MAGLHNSTAGCCRSLLQGHISFLTNFGPLRKNIPFPHTNRLPLCKLRPCVAAGDSLQNILGDLLSCGGGYLLGTLFAALELWWLSLVWLVLSELACILYMRDSLLLNILSLVVHSDKAASQNIGRQSKC